MGSLERHQHRPESVSAEVVLQRALAMEQRLQICPDSSENFARWTMKYLKDKNYREEIDETTGELLIRHPDGYVQPYEDFVDRVFPAIYRLMINELIRQGRLVVQ